jgi:hypothetical protein
MAEGRCKNEMVVDEIRKGIVVAEGPKVKKGKDAPL